MLVFFLLNMDAIARNYFKDEIMLRYNAIIDEIPAKTSLPFDPNNGNLREWDVLYTLLTTLSTVLQYMIMIYCGWKMYTKMEEKVALLSDSLKNHHRQLFKTLVLQISCPTIFLFSPLMLIIYLPYCQMKISFPADVFFTAYNIYPAMDSTIVFLTITEYRFAAKRWCLKTD
ncbi:hypothetical protein L3Y34_006857 [Caenorhabditis briggsae]|uniref:Uncharacterized protein n=1 Tax=Caenorhabditis briggsae TaxID=6238 RepID=A0AAE8ZYS5_CAEBR|nr:hypothetical protein L3Y34_006857 [Caenorhabditis briggsae]